MEEAEVIDEETRIHNALNEAIGQFNKYYREKELNAVRDGLSSDMLR